MSERLASFHNRHQGETAVLVCNGPSLNQMDLRFLRKHFCIGFNKIFFGFKKFAFYPKYYVAVNDLVIEQSVADIKALNCVKFISKRNAHRVPETALNGACTVFDKQHYTHVFHNDL